MQACRPKVSCKDCLAPVKHWQFESMEVLLLVQVAHVSDTGESSCQVGKKGRKANCREKQSLTSDPPRNVSDGNLSLTMSCFHAFFKSSVLSIF